MPDFILRSGMTMLNYTNTHTFNVVVRVNADQPNRVHVIREASPTDMVGFPIYDGGTSAMLEEMLEQLTTKSIEKYPELVFEVKPSKRRLQVPVFKHKYDTVEDAKLRLAGTLINIGGDTYYVRDIVAYRKEFILFVEDSDKKRWRVPFSNGCIDCRSPEPRYIQHSSTPSFFLRTPKRQQRQGVSSDNTFLKPVGSSQFIPWHDAHSLIKSLKPQSNLVYEEIYNTMMVKQGLFNKMRLSNSIALYRPEQTEILVTEFRGRELGELKENVILVDDEDYDQPWIHQAVSNVGLSLRKVK